MNKNLFHKIYRSLRLFVLMAVFIILLVPFMFVSLLGKGVNRVKQFLGLKTKDKDMNWNEAWADIPGTTTTTTTTTGRCIYLYHKDKNGFPIKFSEIVPRTEESTALAFIPKSAVKNDGSLSIDMRWTRTHHLLSLGLIEYDAEKSKYNGGFREFELVSAVNKRDGIDYAAVLKDNNFNYMNTIQSDEVDLVFRRSTSGVEEERSDGKTPDVESRSVKLQIKELDPEESFIDHVRLSSVIHDEKDEVVVGSDFKNYYLIEKDKIASAKLPDSVSILGKDRSVSEVFGQSYNSGGDGIYLHAGHGAQVYFSGLDADKSYALLINAKERGWSPKALTAFNLFPKPVRLAARSALLAVLAYASRGFLGEFSLVLPFFALFQSTPFLAVEDGKGGYIMENDVMFSNVFNYDSDYETAKDRFESGVCGPDLYKIKNLRRALPDGRVETYLFSASGFYTDLRPRR